MHAIEEFYMGNAHELDHEIGDLVAKERGITKRLLEKIALFDRNHYYADLGYGSLMAWLVEHHKYSKSAAYRRMQAARVISVVPDASNKIESGSVNLSTLASLQTAIRQEEMQILKRLKEVTSHAHFNASWSQIFVVAAKEYLNRHDPLQKKSRAEMKTSNMDNGKMQTTSSTVSCLEGRNFTPSQIGSASELSGRSSRKIALPCVTRIEKSTGLPGVRRPKSRHVRAFGWRAD